MFKFVIHVGISTHPGGRGISVEKLLQQAKSALEKAREEGDHTYVQFTG